MEQLINIYNEFYGDIFITIIRILVGILRILSNSSLLWWDIRNGYSVLP